MRTSLFAVLVLTTAAAVPGVVRAEPAGTEQGVCDAVKTMIKRTSTRYVVEDGVDCKTPVRLPEVRALDATVRFNRGLVASGFTLISAGNEQRIKSAPTPPWLTQILVECPAEGAPKAPLYSLAVAVDPKGKVLTASLSASSNEATTRGKCILARAQQQRLDPAPKDEVAMYTYPLLAAAMPSELPAGLKAKIPIIEQEKREHAAKQGASSQPAPAHDHAH
jgi:hypothetical protein